MQPETIMDSVSLNVLTCLGAKSLEEFRRLDPETRRELLRTSLVDPKPIELGIESSSPDNPDVYLRQQKFAGSSVEVRQVIKESREVYYGDNHFAIRLQYLDTFMLDPLQQRLDSRVAVPIVALVRRITVLLDLHRGQANQLRKLLKFETPTRLHSSCGTGDCRMAVTSRHIKHCMT